MKNNNKYTIALGFALLLLIITLVMLITGNGSKTGPLLIAFFITLSFAVKGFSVYEGFIFYNVDVYCSHSCNVLSSIFCFNGWISIENSYCPASADNYVWDGFTDEPQ